MIIIITQRKMFKCVHDSYLTISIIINISFFYEFTHIGI